ncbi:pentatricopeptide repeat-containing protein At2g01860 [Cryptomeria japonica]|uniref:pentatricopeptide repeat-containing protein At2g01860 n=1 Tax=Cryptomeria japonica TaxID=3369 RepID=UPI0027DA5F86|nr:pentatricopeptide repeat-containing protein At2g01860 [Cryptomeria japonica]
MMCILSENWVYSGLATSRGVVLPHNNLLKYNLGCRQLNRSILRKIPRVCLIEMSTGRICTIKVFSSIQLHGFQAEEHADSEMSGTSDEEMDYISDGDSIEDIEGEWSADQLDTIASLFRSLTPPKSRSQMKERYLPLPMPHKIRPTGVPQSKRAFRSPNPLNRVYKNPQFLINLAREIRDLSPEEEVSKVLDKWECVLRKGSLSLTIRELGHMGLPQRALQTFCWAQKCPKLYPDDRILGSILQVLARAGELKTLFDLKSTLASCNRNTLESIARGYIKSGQCRQAREVLLAARDSLFKLDDGIHAKLIVEASKSRRWHNLAGKLIEELGMRDELKLEIQDCTAVMKGCIRLGMYEAVESLFFWWKESGHRPNVVMYTTIMHSRYCSGKFRKAFALVWEMEESNCLLDLPAYRVIIRLCAELGDLSRAARYFSKMKDASFVPTRDIYSNLIALYFKSGRVVKCRELLKEVERIGIKPNLEILQHRFESLSERKQ